MSSNIRAGRAFVEIGVTDRWTAPLRTAAARLKSFGSATQNVGKSMIAAGLTAGAPIIGSAMLFAGFDQGMQNVAAKSGATAEQMQALRAKAKELGATTSFSATEAAQGMEMLAQAGLNADQILGGIGPMLKLAAAGALDLGTAADIATNIATPFGIAADEIGRVADVLAVTATSSNTDVISLGESFKMVAPLAAATGNSLEEMAAALGVMANQGMKGTMAGTGLADMMKTMVEPAAIEQFKKLGVETQDAAGNLRPVRDLMRDLNTKTSGMTQGERIGILQNVYGLHLKTGLALMDNMELYDQLAAKTTNAGGASDRMAATMLDSVKGSFLILKSAVEGVAIEIGEAIKAPLRSVMDTGAAIFSALTGVVAANPEIVQAISGVIAAIVGIGGALVGIGMFAKFAGIGLGMLISGFSMLIAPVTALWGMLGGVTGILGIFGAGMGAIASPALLLAAVIASVAAVIGYLVITSESGSAAMAGFADGVGAAVDYVVGYLKTLWEIASTAFGGIKDALQAGDLGLAAQIAGQALYAGFVETFGGVLTFFDNIITKIRGGFLEVVKVASQLFGWLADKLPGGAGEYFRTMEADLTATQDRLKEENQARNEGRINARQKLDDLRGQAAERLAEKNGEAEAKARTAAADAPAPMATEDTIWTSGSLETVKKKADEALGALGGAALGTFSGFAAGLLGSARPADERTAKATERTAKAAEDLVKIIPDIKPEPAVFGP